jgi:hypothetical protein
MASRPDRRVRVFRDASARGKMEEEVEQRDPGTEPGWIEPDRRD